MRHDVGIQHPKLSVQRIDFADSASWRDKVRGDVLFSYLGTTLKAAGSQVAQQVVDYGYQLAFAQAAAANGVGTLALVSAGGAAPNAKLFYPRIKGELEQAVQALDFEQLVIFRPPLLLRPDSDRPAEIWGTKLLKLLNTIGLFKSQTPLATDKLAAAMIRAVKQQHTGTRIMEAQEIWRLFD
ncbi:hypothetical protein [Testudinibacter sp. TR-2022]|uniref:hypothetical protein n=1 Tax=Testudinibacter sp. TR-2022 TaxID=2585029 RepID=UPI002278A795|nr:hypothetical protein [Testudinibacter sp. TR-2022]